MENSRYYGAPTRKDWKMTKMVMDPDRHFTTFEAGKLVPLYAYSDVLPGEEYEIDLNFLVRSLTPIHPVMDSAYLDVRAFFVPHRIEWEKWENFVGANPTGYWVDSNTYTIPQVTAGDNGFLPGSVADYMRIPTKVAGVKANALAFRAYVDVYNNWYRSTDVDSPGARPVNSTGVNSPTTLGDPITEAYKGGALFDVCRLPDYFSTGTPQPIRSLSPVSITFPDAPVVEAGDDEVAGTRLGWTYDGDIAVTGNQSVTVGKQSGGSGAAGRTFTNGTVEISQDSDEIFAHLKADLSAVAFNVDEMRFAIQYYRLLQRDLYGSRYKSLILNHFGTNLPDSTAQIPQYIGGNRYRLNQQQVAQTSATGDGTPLGNLGAFSLTRSGSMRKWRVACPEWGTLLVVACVRVVHSYQQGLHPQWSRQSRIDLFWPPFGQLGAQPIYKRELKAEGSALTSHDNEVFAYKEAWDEYRTTFSGCSGMMRSNVDDSLDVYHYADYYENAPSLSSSWLHEGSNEIKRTLAVQTGDSFFGEFVLNVTKTTPIPAHSEGKFMDHF